MFAANGFAGKRRVIDISGDGPNNRGGPSSVDLDIYYQDYVIGGPGAFMIPVTGMKNFAQAILTKLIREIAGRELPVRNTNAARLVD